MTRRRMPTTAYNGESNARARRVRRLRDGFEWQLNMSVEHCWGDGLDARLCKAQCNVDLLDSTQGLQLMVVSHVAEDYDQLMEKASRSRRATPEMGIECALVTDDTCFNSVEAVCFPDNLRMIDQWFHHHERPACFRLADRDPFADLGLDTRT